MFIFSNFLAVNKKYGRTKKNIFERYQIIIKCQAECLFHIFFNFKFLVSLYHLRGKSTSFKLI